MDKKNSLQRLIKRNYFYILFAIVVCVLSYRIILWGMTPSVRDFGLWLPNSYIMSRTNPSKCMIRHAYKEKGNSFDSWDDSWVIPPNITKVNMINGVIFGYSCRVIKDIESKGYFYLDTNTGTVGIQYSIDIDRLEVMTFSVYPFLICFVGLGT